MRILLAALLLGGCQPEPKDFDPLPGGGGGLGGSSGGNTDGPLGDALINPLSGRVCLVTDLRQPLTGCSTSLAGNLVVTLGSSSAVTEADGSFVIETPGGTGLTWRVTGANIVTTVSDLGTIPQVPAIGVSRYNDLLLDNGIILSPGQGSVVIDVVDSDGAVSGVLASSTPLAQFATHYDGASALVWDQDQTGSFGIAWIPGVAAGPAVVTIDPPVGSDVSSTIAVEDGAITFVTFGL